MAKKKKKKLCKKKTTNKWVGWVDLPIEHVKVGQVGWAGLAHFNSSEKNTITFYQKSNPKNHNFHNTPIRNALHRQVDT